MSPLTRRVTACYRQAQPLHLATGARWYPDAHTVARDQSITYGVTIEVASGVLAALSPRCGWGRNVMLAERMLASGGTLDHGCLGRSLAQARAICEVGRPLDVLGGPKTRAFYSAVLTAGESPDPVIDSHAWDMLVGIRKAPAPTLKQYREGAKRMIAAAQILDNTVHHVQAVTWLEWRSRFQRRGMYDHTPQLMLEGALTW